MRNQEQAFFLVGNDDNAQSSFTITFKENNHWFEYYWQVSLYSLWQSFRKPFLINNATIFFLFEKSNALQENDNSEMN